MFHLAEAYRARTAKIEERPAPAEIGGYALVTETEYSSVIANAGGFQMQANLRGQIAESSGNFWTPLGVVRFARAGWETRLGPSDGALTAMSGVSFAPAFSEMGQWLRLASMSTRYEGQWSVQFVHPLLVRCAIAYRPRHGGIGPSFRNEFVLTPDGVLSTTVKTSPEEQEWGVTWPLLENDGAPLPRFHTPGVEAVGYPGSSDREKLHSAGRRLAIYDGTAGARDVRRLAADSGNSFGRGEPHVRVSGECGRSYGRFGAAEFLNYTRWIPVGAWACLGHGLRRPDSSWGRG